MNRTETAAKVQPDQRAASSAFVWAAALLLIWLSVWIVVSWPYSLDDALIHLRYADHLLHEHRVTYDGVHASFGTSSLLYVSVLAGLRAIFSSPLLPRSVSSFVYLALFVCLAGALRRALLSGGEQPRVFWVMGFAILCVMVAPSAVRWLDDGMETGLVFFDALLAMLLLRRLARETRLGTGILLASFSYGLFTVLLRVELLLLVGCVSVMVALEMSTGRVRRMAVEHPGRVMILAATPLTGGLAAALLIVLSMHALLPDTALAKAFGVRAWQDTFQMTALTVASSFSFGTGLLLLWLLSLVSLLVWKRPRWADLPGNMLFPCVLLVAATRGQQIQGIRYFGWTIFFPLLWNFLRLTEEAQKPTLEFCRGFSVALLVLFAGLAPAFVWESGTFHRLFADRGAALNAFRAQKHLQSLQGQLGVAEDVGFVGYFTQGNICDPYGLVNGRAAARLNYLQRFDHCMAQRPVFAFGSREFLQKVTYARPLTGWAVCGEYAFDNVRTRDVHYLVVEPQAARRACPEMAQPIAQVLPGLL